MGADNSVLINEQGEIDREMYLHIARIAECNDMDQVKKEMISHIQKELAIREKYANYAIEQINAFKCDYELER